VQIDEMIMVSVDDHIVDPPDMFERHLPARGHDIARHVERRDDGSDVWVHDDSCASSTTRPASDRIGTADKGKR
jgi:hypothetical protein